MGNKLKKRVRERMARTGESYQAALQAMNLGRPEPVPYTEAPRVSDVALGLSRAAREEGATEIVIVKNRPRRAPE